MKKVEYGLCEWSVKTRGRKLCQLAADKKLDCLQLGVGEEIFAGQGLGSQYLIEEYQEACQQYGVKIHSLSPQFVDQYSFTMPQGNQDEEVAAALVERAIELSETFGCRSFLLPVLCKNDICSSTSFHRTVEYIKKYSAMAAEKGIETYLELNQGAEQVRNLLDAVDNPMVKILFDSQNLYAQNGTSMARYFKELFDVIACVHLKDGIGTMLSGSLLGEGDSGFFKTVEAIRNSEYAGALLIESVYSKPTVCRLGSEEMLLEKDAQMLHEMFD